MDKQSILDELRALLEQTDVTVRTDALGGGGGGLCKVKDKAIFFVDTQSSAAENAEICARAVAELIEIENIYIRPEIREFIENVDKSDRLG